MNFPITASIIFANYHINILSSNILNFLFMKKTLALLVLLPPQ